MTISVGKAERDKKGHVYGVAACLEAGFEDYQQLREDPDLEGVREDKRFETLIGKFNRSNSNGFFGSFLKGFKL